MSCSIRVSCGSLVELPMTRSESRRCVRRKELSTQISGLFSGSAPRTLGPGARTKTGHTRSKSLYCSMETMLLKRIPRCSPTPSPASEKNADALRRFSKQALSQYLQTQPSNSRRIFYCSSPRRLTTPFPSMPHSHVQAFGCHCQPHGTQ
jgi:hypothetical protein